MKLAIMQPYFFPYLGYFQLLAATDKFVVYDDVNYIKGGWINRNRILINGEIRFFTVPLSGASSFVQINKVAINEQNQKWRAKMLDTFRMAYRRAAYRDIGVNLLDEVLAVECESIAALARASLNAVMDFLGLDRKRVPSSNIYSNQILKAQERVLDICDKEKADVYINLAGGVHLYQQEAFKRQGCDLQFLRSQLPEYPQANDRLFVPGLSILDAIMHCSREQIVAMLGQYELVDEKTVLSQMGQRATVADGGM